MEIISNRGKFSAGENGENIKAIKLSPEVTLLPKKVYLVRIDCADVRKGRTTGELVLYKSEEEAKHATESLAKAEVKNMSSEFVRVYMENVNEPAPYIKRVDIYKQSLGFFLDSSPVKICTFGCVEVPFGNYRDSLMDDDCNDSDSD
jgi:hypothetical protein